MMSVPEYIDSDTVSSRMSYGSVLAARIQISLFMSFCACMWPRFIHSEIVTLNCNIATAMQEDQESKFVSALSVRAVVYALSTVNHNDTNQLLEKKNTLSSKHVKLPCHTP